MLLPLKLLCSLILLFLSIPFSIWGQSYQLNDCVDFPQAIAYAHIQNFSNGEATISNHEGYFDIEIDSDEDIIRISHLGYQKLEISAADLKKETKFCLNHEILLLPEVIVGGFSDFELLQKSYFEYT